MNFFTNNLNWLVPLAIWEIVWKGIGLWRSARAEHRYWFAAMLIINTAGILPIIYLLFFQNREKKKAKTK
ncbi:MAG: DUF5652 family protein [Patescibacteria group bacterium]|nr:DUF5652 family protein [Patescibacteria group bacterium]